MKTYHIVWFEKVGDIYSKGKNYKGDDPIDALLQFRHENINAIFHSMSVKDE